MASVTSLRSPVRAGVYSRPEDAATAVEALLRSGFARNEITVVCSDDAKEKHFKAFEHQQPAGTGTPEAAAAGSTLGAALGGIATTALGIAIGGLPLLLVGGAGLLTGGVVGGFLGAMMMRGVDKEVADFYDQAVQKGKLLVAVEDHSASAPERLARAEHVFLTTGAEPIALPEG
jgi:hypothetical protein